MRIPNPNKDPEMDPSSLINTVSDDVRIRQRLLIQNDRLPYRNPDSSTSDLMCEDCFLTFTATAGKHFLMRQFLDSQLGLKSCCPLSVMHWTWKTWIPIKEKFRSAKFASRLSFLFPSSFQDHMDTHAGVKKHICDFCHKTFTKKNTLKNHRRLHTGWFFNWFILSFVSFVSIPIWSGAFGNHICYNAIQYIVFCIRFKDKFVSVVFTDTNWCSGGEHWTVCRLLNLDTSVLLFLSVEC